SAAAFPDSIAGLPPTGVQLYDAAQYHSQSVESNEKLVIGRANVFPVRAGRWYLSVLNFGTAANPTLTATLSDLPPGPVPIEIVFNDPANDCGIAEWSNSAGRAPVAGNNGTTLGAQRQNAVNEAIRLIRSELKSDLPVRVQGCWKNLGVGTSFTLAQAGPRDLARNYPWAPRGNTYYSSAAATKLGGAAYCGIAGGSCDTTYDIRVTFNDQVDTSAIQSDFYYGFTGTGTFGSVDYIAVAMHELAHGLGFISTINTRAADGPVGQRLNGTDDAFGHNLVGVNASDGSLKRFMAMTDAERAAAITGIDRLRWDEPRAVSSPFNVASSFGAPDSYIYMHTPSPIVPGSSLSHVGVRHSGDLMTAQASRGQRSLLLAGPMLEAVGWSTTPPGTVLSTPLPASNNLFDVRRDGHGIDLVRVRDNIYALTLYTYDVNGEPEWYQAVGSVENGLFTANTDANGKSLFRFRYSTATTPPQQVVSSQSGTVALDFNNPASEFPCNDGRPNPAGAVAVMTFSLGTDQNVRWCMQPVVTATARPTPDFSGIWHAGPQDDGWGWSILNFTTGSATSTFSLLFYYDINGNPVWSYSLHSGVSANTATPLVHRRAYCRSCPSAAFVDQPAGTVTFGFVNPSSAQAANNRVTYTSTPQNTVGGVFARTNSPLILLTTPQ
ncbi:MAG: hypothetical protein ABIP49_01675, partial [Lysobacterales bacterium]